MLTALTLPRREGDYISFPFQSILDLNSYQLLAERIQATSTKLLGSPSTKATSNALPICSTSRAQSALEASRHRSHTGTAVCFVLIHSTAAHEVTAALTASNPNSPPTLLLFEISHSKVLQTTKIVSFNLATSCLPQPWHHPLRAFTLVFGTDTKQKLLP